jgi:hypothetical protein
VGPAGSPMRVRVGPVGSKSPDAGVT